MAPEIMARVTYTYKADIWSVGVMAYQLNTGNFPFVGSSRLDLK